MRLDEEWSLKACFRASRPDVLVAGSCRPSRAYRHRGESAVGTAVNVRHLAATPVGRLVTGWAEATKVDGRQIKFTVRATEGTKEIGAGSHSRVVIDVAKFVR
jgi:predicted thioesterase